MKLDPKRQLHCDMQVTMAWWLRPYIVVLVWVAVLMRREPDWLKLEAVIASAVRFKIEATRVVLQDDEHGGA